MQFSSLKPVFMLLMSIPFLIALKKKQNQVDATLKLDVNEEHVKLSDELLEISGMVPFKEGFIALNDGGPDNKLYVIDSNGRVLRKVVVDTENVDWEALTIGDGKLFIGDVGNNFGTRVNLSLIEISLDQLERDTLRSNDFNVITFKTPWISEWIDQSKHDKDCEAMVYRSNRIHFFSKNRLTDEVVHVALDLSNRDSIKATILESTLIKGQITDACFDRDGALLLLGYKAPSFKTFVVRFSSTGDEFFFNGERSKHKIGSFLHYGQSEAICISTNNQIVIGSEGNRKINRRARMHRVNLN